MECENMNMRRRHQMREEKMISYNCSILSYDIEFHGPNFRREVENADIPRVYGQIGETFGIDVRLLGAGVRKGMDPSTGIFLEKLLTGGMKVGNGRHIPQPGRGKGNPNHNLNQEYPCRLQPLLVRSKALAWQPERVNRQKAIKASRLP